ncbi:conserved hypothetical protein [Frankia canadensis]|uniref:Uncharacterized protein n=1 Tax=Frankia canadensis TaxID=1836972 RepID=A0A2I2KTG4_9ACTN|nr:conserved hypothetical protein [Frankia canadensis]SOU56253.1 conserved hypothetical protein [Frankia canadensis]
MASPSLLGGFEEFLEFFPSRAFSSEISAVACARASTASAACRRASATSWRSMPINATSSSYDGAG